MSRVGWRVDGLGSGVGARSVMRVAGGEWTEGVVEILPSVALERERVRDARPTRELPTVSARLLRSRRGRALLAAALAGPLLLSLGVSAVLVLSPPPRLPEPMRALVGSLFLWAERTSASSREAAPRAPVSTVLPAPMPAAPTAVAAPGAGGQVAQAKTPGPVVQVSGAGCPVPAVTPAVSGAPGASARRSVAPAAMTVAESLEERLDKDFERELGFAPDAPAHPVAMPTRPTRTVYVPPEPGVAPREVLSTSDIVEGVLAHKQAVLACIHAYAPGPRGEEPGRLVMRWRVLPGGTVTDVAVEDEALRGSPLAGCMEAQVRTWTFPRHRVPAAEPVHFPFTY